MSTTERETGERHVIDFDHHAPEFRDRCPEIVAELHASGCPLGFSEDHGGFWALYGYDAVYEAVQDWQLFSSAHTIERPKGIPAGPDRDPFIPIDLDGPIVQEYRRVVLSWLSPAGAKGMEPRIREMVTELIDEFIETGSADLGEQLYTAVPARVILELLGWETERWSEWIQWVHALIHDRTDNPAKAADAIANVGMNIMIEIEKRRDDPGDDLFSELMKARFDGRPFTDAELIGYGFLLLLGGMDTTAGLTGNALVRLDEQPELRRQLIDDPSLMPKATEEFLRHDSPSFGLYRTVTRDTEFHGQPLKAGDKAMLMFPAAGLDAKQFDDPETIDFSRTANRHMAFGLGPHRCLGSHHARIMFQTMLGEILRRLPDYRIDGGYSRFHDAGDVYAVRSLPVTFTPGQRSTAT